MWLRVLLTLLLAGFLVLVGVVSFMMSDDEDGAT